jgi:uncharacterized protein YjbJ (UPF0337 family)
MSNNTIDKISGKAKILAGRATHSKRLETRGKIQYEMAQFRQKAEDVMRLLSDEQ